MKLKQATDKLMGYLAQKCQPILEWKYFDFTTALIMFINPFALSPQLYRVITQSDVSSVSTESLGLFALIQVTFGIIAIKDKKFWIWVSMVISFIFSLTTITIVLIKS